MRSIFIPHHPKQFVDVILFRLEENMVPGEFRLVLMGCPTADLFEGRVGYDKTVQDNVFLEYIFAKFGVMSVFFALLGVF